MKKLLFLIVLLLVPFAFASSQGSDNDTLWTKKFPTASGNITQISFTPDSQNVAVASGGSILVFKISNGELVKKFSENTELIYSFKISEDGSILVTSTTTPLITVWDFLTGDTIRTIKVPASVTSISLFNNNFIIGIVQNKTITNNIYIWDANTGKIINQIGNGWYWSLALSKQKNIFAIGTQGDVSHKSNVELWDLSTLKYITTLGSNSERFDGAAFSPDGKYLGTACADGYVKIWDVDTRQLKYTFSDDSVAYKYYKICFTSDSKYVIAGGGYWQNVNTKVWELENGKLIYVYKHPLGSIVGLDVSNNDNFIGTGFGSVLSLLNNQWQKTNITDLNINLKLLFPNPASDYIEINIPFDLNQRFKSLVQYVRCYNVFGIEVYLPKSNDIISSSSFQYSLRLDVSGFVPGVYFVKIGDKVQRFVKI